MNFLVFQHLDVEHPGIFRDFMKAQGVNWDTLNWDIGETLGPNAHGLDRYDALMVLGGPAGSLLAKSKKYGDLTRKYLDLIMAVKVVESIEDAVKHINKYGSGHSDAIITSNYKNSGYFTKYVDSSTVYVNASTRFTDGGEFGMGAEIGISTQKLHWRGPMSLRQITTNKFIIYGNGQIRS